MSACELYGGYDQESESSNFRVNGKGGLVHEKLLILRKTISSSSCALFLSPPNPQDFAFVITTT